MRDFGWVHLSAGDLLRDAQRSGDDTARMIDQHIKEGQLVPAELVVQLIRKAMDIQVARGNLRFLVDGQQRSRSPVSPSLLLCLLPISPSPPSLCAVQASLAELRTWTAGIA